MAASSEQWWIGAETGILKGLDLVKRTTTNFTDFKTLNKQQEIHVMCWGPQGKDQLELDLGKNVKKMKQHKEKSNIIATGGKENELKVYDLEKPDQPIFLAKNVRHNFLDLRVPVWINDMQFLSGESNKIVTCTAHHQVRLYDLNTPQRRPVLDVEFQDCPIMALDVTPDQRSVIVGNAQGQLGRIDFRNGIYSKNYKGFAGSIRSVQCHPTLPLVGTCGLDRFFRLHHLRTGKMEKKVYLKSRLNCFLYTDRDHTEDLLVKEKEDAKEEERKVEEKEEGGESDDELWQGMEEVADDTEGTSKRRKNSEA
ncbi:putative WD repeat-containing protein 74 isoform X2 [Apostichopus japonicus]|uniref:Putative WD repeat-containing protein 74 isoform X2 n=1 Tax=Stichopus japonicus TaxID=307972 RepID=A0A2G8KKF7_STIJA|nr:putative WD repeat-containing protein 74 isoform X2 [Apostichopus japonicus]